METQKQAHPTAGELAAFALKRLKPDKHAQLQEHVSACRQCTKFLQDNPPDKLAARLRQLAASRLSQQSTPGIGEGGTLASVPRSANHPANAAADPPAVGKSPPAAAAGKPAVSRDPAKPLPIAKPIALRSAASPKAPGSPAARKPAPRNQDDIPADLRQQDRYEIVRKIGEGGMGSVFEGFHKLMKRRVAIKTINASISGHPDALKRFLREVEAAAKLSHPNIAQAYDADKFGASHVLISEFVDGQSLDRVIDDGGSLPVAQACEYVQQAARGLQNALEHGLAHRDIKPSNLMLTPLGTVKILDFGLAKIRGAERESAGLTGMDRGMGTAQYMAPEQALDAANADIRADIYALGCTLYCLLTGAPPWEGDVVSVLTSHQRDIAQPVCERRPDVPKPLSDLVARMLAKEPADRPQTPTEVAELLEPFVAKAEAPARPAAPDEPGPAADEFAFALDRAPAPVAKGGMRAVTRGAPRPGLIAALVSAKRPPWFWPVVGGGAAALFVVVVFVALGVFKARTPEGTIVIENVPADAEVLVDDNQVKLTRAGDTVTITAMSNAEHHLKLMRDGKTIWSSDVRVDIGGTPVRVSYVPQGSNAHDRSKHSKTQDVAREPDTRQPTNDAWSQDRFPYAETKMGSWSIDGADLVLDGRQNGAFLAFGNPAWSNYDLTFRAKVVEGTNGFQAFFALTDWQNYRMFEAGAWNNTWRILISVQDGRWKDVPKIERHGGITKDEWHNVRIEVRGTTCTCLLDGEKIADQTNDAQYPVGRIGFASVPGTIVRVSEIRVTSTDGVNVYWSGLPKIPTADAPATATPAVAAAPLVPADPAARVARVFSGEWTCEGDELQQHSEAPAFAALTMGDINWQDADISLEVRTPDAPKSEVLVAFNCKDTYKYRFLRFGIGYHNLNRQNGFNDYTLIKRFHEPLEPCWHQVEIKIRGSRCECFVDGKLLIRDDNAEYVGGCLGLGSFQTKGRFRKITIKSGGDTGLLWTGLPTIPEELTPFPGVPADVAAIPAVPPPRGSACWRSPERWLRTTAQRQGPDGLGDARKAAGQLASERWLARRSRWAQPSVQQARRLAECPRAREGARQLGRQQWCFRSFQLWHYSRY